MSQPIVATGTLTDSRTITLDEPVHAVSGKVRVVLEAAPPERQPRVTAQEFEKTLRERQAARGHVPPTKEEVDAYIKAERESWDF